MTPARQLGRQLEGFIAKFTPEVAQCARTALAKVRKLCPGATELVYDNYNALVIGFAPSERSSEAVFSIVLYPRWVSFFFLQGRWLPDPHGLLQGKGSTVRHILLTTPAVLDRPEVRALITEAQLNAKVAFDPNRPRLLIIKSISAKQRPRPPIV
jgi:hypothetical protein